MCQKVNRKFEPSSGNTKMTLWVQNDDLQTDWTFTISNASGVLNI